MQLCKQWRNNAPVSHHTIISMAVVEAATGKNTEGAEPCVSEMQPRFQGIQKSAVLGIIVAAPVSESSQGSNMVFCMGFGKAGTPSDSSASMLLCCSHRAKRRCPRVILTAQSSWRTAQQRSRPRSKRLSVRQSRQVRLQSADEWLCEYCSTIT